MANNVKEEPKTAPQSDRWYNLTLGPSIKPDSSNKYCTLRYDFKPASIDNSKRGSMHKNKDNRVSVEFQNNQLGKPNVMFEGSSEDYRENDAVLFFDGQSFRLERLHRAVKRLRLVRHHGEHAAAAPGAIISGPAVEPRLSPPIGKGGKPVNVGRRSDPAAVRVEVERIDIGEPEITGSRPAGKGISYQSEPPNESPASPAAKKDDFEDHQDIDIDDIFGNVSSDDGNADKQKNDVGFDINVPQNSNSDDVIADVDDSGDEVNKGPNAAEALRAQVNAEERGNHTSSSSSSSGSGSSSSDGEASDDDSVTSI